MANWLKFMLSVPQAFTALFGYDANASLEDNIVRESFAWAKYVLSGNA